MNNNGATKIKIFNSEWHCLRNTFDEEEVNNFMEKVEDNGGEIVDIKFQVNKLDSSSKTSVMVIYKL